METTAGQRGFSRPKAQTPYEYRQTLAKAYPGGEIDIRIITEAYVKVRYGELPEDDRQLTAVREAFDRLKAIAPPVQS
jgi:hypothetical protein